MAETLSLAERVRAGHPQLDLALRLIRNTGVRTRFIVRPLPEILRHPRFQARDAVAAAVVRGQGGVGPRLECNTSYLIPDTERWIGYDVKETGFHFVLDRRVPATMEPLSPVLRRFARERAWDASDLDFYVVHAGGPRILDDLARFLEVDRSRFDHSRATLENYGNIASAVVLDALRRIFDDGGPRPGSRGLIAGFGPGITAEICMATWAGEEDEVLLAHSELAGQAAC